MSAIVLLVKESLSWLIKVVTTPRLANNTSEHRIEMFKTPVMHDLLIYNIRVMALLLELVGGGGFARPNANNVYKGENVLRSIGLVVWNNMLPERLKSCSILAKFKNSIKSWIPKNCPLCKHYVQDAVSSQLWFKGPFLSKQSFNNVVYLQSKYFENSSFIYVY